MFTNPACLLHFCLSLIYKHNPPLFMNDQGANIPDNTQDPLQDDGPDTKVEFVPQEDITAYELAQLLPLFLSPSGGSEVMKLIDQEHPAARHFQVVPD